jgi:hypothetical protein
MAHTYGCIYQSCRADFATWQEMVDHQDLRHATGDDITNAYGAGRKAYLEGRPDAPGTDWVILDLIADARVGEPRTLELFREFSKGYGNARVLELPYGVQS